MYEAIIEPPAERFILQLKKEEQIKLLDAIEQLENNPRLGKELVGRLQGLRSLRMDSYRIIYKVEDLKLLVLVLRIGHRENIYAQKMEK